MAERANPALSEREYCPSHGWYERSAAPWTPACPECVYGTCGPDPLERVETETNHADYSSTFTRHGVYARCPECRHSTVGLERPWVINHKRECSVPTEGYGAR